MGLRKLSGGYDRGPLLEDIREPLVVHRTKGSYKVFPKIAMDESDELLDLIELSHI